jgi:hypothetical protein
MQFSDEIGKFTLANERLTAETFVRGRDQSNRVPAIGGGAPPFFQGGASAHNG